MTVLILAIRFDSGVKIKPNRKSGDLLSQIKPFWRKIIIAGPEEGQLPDFIRDESYGKTVKNPGMVDCLLYAIQKYRINDDLLVITTGMRSPLFLPGMLEFFRKNRGVISAPHYIFPRETLPLVQIYLRDGNPPESFGAFISWLGKRVPVYDYRDNPDLMPS